MQDSRARLFLPVIIPSAILAVSTASIFIRFAQAEGAPSLVIASVRLSIATLLLAPFALTKYLVEIKRFTRTEILLGAFSGIFLAIHFATWISSLEYTSVASSAVFVSTGPLWVALLAPLLLKERLTKTAILGLILALAGGTVIGLSDACVWESGLVCADVQNILQGRAMWGNILALVGALAVSGYLIIGRRLRNAGNMSLIPYIFLVYGMAAVTLNVIMFFSGHSPFGYSPKIYGLIFLLAAIPQLIGHSTFNWLLKFLPATFVAVTTLSEPIGSAILAYFILHETPTSFVIIGGCILLIGIYLTSREETKTSKESK